MSIEDATPVTEGAWSDAAGPVPSPRGPWTDGPPPGREQVAADDPAAATAAANSLPDGRSFPDGPSHPDYASLSDGPFLLDDPSFPGGPAVVDDLSFLDGPTGELPLVAPLPPAPGYPMAFAVPPGPPLSYPAAHPGFLAPPPPAAPPSSPWPASLAVPLPPRRPGRVRRALTVAVLVILVLVAGAQAYELKRLNDRLDRADRNDAAAQARADAQIGLLKTRATELENTIAAQLDPISVAAQIAPSVYELDAGDFLGTAWAVRNSAGGTDLITNYHVVAPIYKQGKRAVNLVRGTERLHATVVKVSTANDVALVHVDRSVPVLDVEKAVVSGEAVLVEGTPLGWQASVTTGVVSNVERKVRTANGTIVYFQFDAAINPGNSGGPVVDARGRVLGVASAVFIDTQNDVPAQSMSLAIPVTTVCRVLAAC